MAPTACNYRYRSVRSQKPGSWWFGGGADLTPSYLFEEDATHFHQVHKDACDRHEVADFAKFKQWCDDYFHIKHFMREEAPEYFLMILTMLIGRTVSPS